MDKGKYPFEMSFGIHLAIRDFHEHFFQPFSTLKQFLGGEKVGRRPALCCYIEKKMSSNFYYFL